MSSWDAWQEPPGFADEMMLLTKDELRERIGAVRARLDQQIADNVRGAARAAVLAELSAMQKHCSHAYEPVLNGGRWYCAACYRPTTRRFPLDADAILEGDRDGDIIAVEFKTSVPGRKVVASQWKGICDQMGVPPRAGRPAPTHPALQDDPMSEVEIMTGFPGPRAFAAHHFNKPESELTPAEVNWAKDLLFNVVYGRQITSLSALSAPDTITEEQAGNIVAQFQEHFPEVTDWIKSMKRPSP